VIIIDPENQKFADSFPYPFPREILLVLTDDMESWEWLTAGKVDTAGEKKGGGQKRRESGRRRSFLSSNGSITPLRHIRILKSH